MKNISYFLLDLQAKNNTKLMITFEKDKVYFKKAHNNYDHLGINRAYNKIKEKDYSWDKILKDIKNYIKNWPICIKNKTGKKINTKTKVIITKGPLERLVIEGWELDQNLKEITRYALVIDMINNFSKFLFSKPIKSQYKIIIQLI